MCAQSTRYYFQTAEETNSLTCSPELVIAKVLLMYQLASLGEHRGVVNMCSVNKVSLSNIERNKTTQLFAQVIYLKTSITVSTYTMISPSGRTNF